MHCIARGQTGYDYRYWFDNDYSYMQEEHSLTDSWQFQADLTGLSESLHAIHIQVADTAGVMSSPVTRFFVKMRDVDVKEGRYWFDNDVSTQRKSDAVQGIMDIDVSALQEGFHTFHYQVIGSDGYYSLPVTRSFYKVLVPEDSYYRCWVDEDYSTLARGKFTGAPILVDITSISEGYHQLRVQIDGSTPSSPVSHSFVKIPQTEGVDYLTCLCSVDDKLFRQEQVASTGGIINWNFDVSSLSQGFHRMQVQVVTPSGAATSTYDAFFLRTTLTEEMNDMKCVYCVDGAEFYTEAGRMSNGAFHCDLDVSALTDGLHRLSYYLTNGKGVSTKMSTQFFIKTPVGGNGIMQYQYWVNGHDDQKHVVTLDKRTNPFSLIKLLPVETQPIRSSNFQFVMKNGSPLIYARNEFHIRFYDTSGRMVEETKEYYDEQVSAAVEPVGELQATQTFDKVAENEIRWYTMLAAPGDTAAFRLSQAATVQVFAPSGKEVFKTSESASVKWAGIHTWEEGTYYLAVHDVTGSQSNMTLDYMHMDKYDVVDWDVHTVGNGGCSTITFKGNGFRDLYAVDFFTAEGDTIQSVDVSHDSDAETAVTFDCTDAELGVYDAVFHFTEEDKQVSEVVTVEEAVDIELATNVSFPSSFLRGTSTTYTIKISNNGNMTAYAVPIYTFLKCHDMNDITKIKYDGLGLTSLMDGIDTEGMSSTEIEQLRTTLESIGDTHHFLKFRVEDEDKQKGDSATILSNYFLINIAPNTTRTLTLTISTRQYAVEVYFTTPKEWRELTYAQEGSGVKSYRFAPKRAIKDWFCCYREGIECVADLVVSLADVGSLVMGIVGAIDPALLPVAGAVAWGDCALSIGNSGLKAAGEFACGSGEEQLKERLKNAAKAAGKSALGATLSCISAKLSSVADLEKLKGKILAGISSELSGNVVGMDIPGLSCITKFTKPIPNCPPCIGCGGGGGGASTPYTPIDPNDIYGYLSDAGSKFMADTVVKVNYTIEFENDTAFATAAAHTIVIRDTLDSRYFDLKSFLPTCVKIGEREVFLDEAADVTLGGVTHFLKTIDMRPEINAIAQVEGAYSQQTGIATWTFTSLDPMTMEPTDDLMQGILPVNYNGTSGIGEVMFEVGLKPNKGDGAEIPNRASIVFDYEEAILTPTWVNTVDAVAPQSTIIGGIQRTDSTLILRLAGEDERSGVWKYAVYAQAGSEAPWELVAENVTDTLCEVRVFDGIDYGFCVLATDSAGNVERKTLEREFELATFLPGDANGDGVVNSTDAQLVVNYYLGKAVYLNFAAADVVTDGQLNSVDAQAIQNIYLNSTQQKQLLPRRARMRKQRAANAEVYSHE